MQSFPEQRRQKNHELIRCGVGQDLVQTECVYRVGTEVHGI